jgi:hypothetical protein
VEPSIHTVMEELRERNSAPNSDNAGDEIAIDLLRDAFVSPAESGRPTSWPFTPIQTGVLGAGTLMTMVVLSMLAVLIVNV